MKKFILGAMKFVALAKPLGSDFEGYEVYLLASKFADKVAEPTELNDMTIEKFMMDIEEVIPEEMGAEYRKAFAWLMKNLEEITYVANDLAIAA